MLKVASAKEEDGYGDKSNHCIEHQVKHCFSRVAIALHTGIVQNKNSTSIYNFCTATTHPAGPTEPGAYFSQP